MIDPLRPPGVEPVRPAIPPPRPSRDAPHERPPERQDGGDGDEERDPPEDGDGLPHVDVRV